MRSLLEMSRFEVLDGKGRHYGRVTEVLFHPERPEVVGFSVSRPRLGMVVDRKERYLALSQVEFGDGALTPAGKGAWDAAAAKLLGFSWDVSVVWLGMPVRTESGAVMGVVRDALFDERTGRLDALGLSGGVTADAAVGVRDLSASLVRGFDGTSVVVAAEAQQVETSGGAAAAAGRGAAVAGKAAGDAAKVAGEAATKAAVYGAVAAKRAAASPAGKKAVGWLKSVAAEVKDAMGDPDDD